MKSQEIVSDTMLVSSESSDRGDVIINLGHIVQEESCVLKKPNSTQTKEVMCEKIKPWLSSEDDLLQFHFRLTKMLRIVDSMDETLENNEKIGKSLETAMSPVAELKIKISPETTMAPVEGFKMKLFAFRVVITLVIFLVVFEIFLFVKDL